MLVDRRKDNYDELLVLARDARASRTRTFRWTTGLIVAAVLGTAAYVSTITQEMHDIREQAEQANGDRDVAENALIGVTGERDALKAELDALTNYHDLYARIVPTDGMSSAISRLRLLPGSTSAVATEPTPGVSSASNIVWMVDGSRRFPMIEGDILWIPESSFWVRLQKVNDQRLLFKHITKPVGGEAAGTGTLLDPMPHREAVSDKGTLDCVMIELHEESLRPLFRDQGYVDVEVTYFKSDGTDPCEPGYRVTPQTP